MVSFLVRAERVIDRDDAGGLLDPDEAAQLLAMRRQELFRDLHRKDIPLLPPAWREPDEQEGVPIQPR